MDDIQLVEGWVGYGNRNDLPFEEAYETHAIFTETLMKSKGLVGIVLVRVETTDYPYGYLACGFWNNREELKAAFAENPDGDRILSDATHISKSMAPLKVRGKHWQMPDKWTVVLCRGTVPDEFAG